LNLGTETTNVNQRILGRIFSSCDIAHFHENNINPTPQDAALLPDYWQWVTVLLFVVLQW